ncbi:hypothetical protein KO561_05590 [Radiobacillus kanasensis]|uniref:hypothetical protein n=1 Tax=Radiobacillus kanasensis TaxID=2844358 RepID=UPI001E287B40|nr:hypothetical protein [Radiobacillus kanasensis]UFU00419.1 hypothetical protein KO561_05590 [Radiobacillus kanasensis]
MQVFATFDHSDYVELAIRKLEQEGFCDIFAVPLDKRTEGAKIFDTLHQSDGISLINKGMFLAVIFSVILSSRGFELDWGPIIWGLIGAGGGFVLGFLIDFIIVAIKRRNKKTTKGKQADLILIVTCEDIQGKQVEEILWDYLALGVAKVKQQ